MSLLCVLLAGRPLTAFADTEIKGSVSDALGGAMEGVKLVASHEGQVLSEAYSDAGGHYRLVVRFGTAGEIAVVAEHPGYAAKSVAVSIRSSEPTADSYDFVLVPEALAACPGGTSAFVVGRFLPPPLQADANLAVYVHQVLSFRILPSLQAQELRTSLDPGYEHLVPQFLLCAEAFPARDDQAAAIAAALEGQGLVWGQVRSVPGSDSLFDVTATIADVNQVFEPPFRVASPGVDLAMPEEAVIAPKARAAVLVSIMAMLQREGQCRAVVYVSNVVAGLIPAQDAPARDPQWDVLAAKDTELRRQCQATLPHAGLVAGGEQ